MGPHRHRDRDWDRDWDRDVVHRQVQQHPDRHRRRCVAPTVPSGQAELTAIRASAATGFAPGEVTTVQRQAGSAVLITYQADSAPNSVTGKVVSQDVQRYEFWNNGTTGDPDAVRAGRVGQRGPVAHRHRLVPVDRMTRPGPRAVLATGAATSTSTPSRADADPTPSTPWPAATRCTGSSAPVTRKPLRCAESHCSVAAGELVAVVGPSGSGKSTLLSLLAGLDEPDGGTVHVQGQRLSHQSEPIRARLRARMIGVLFQSGNLLPHLTVTGNVRLAQRLADHAGRHRVPDPVGRFGPDVTGRRLPRRTVRRGTGPGRPGRRVGQRPAPCCSPTNPPANSTATPKPRCSTCSRPGPGTGWRSWWPATAPPSPPPPTGSSP